jgi:tetratricopeptide (TPR) repeat protein
MAENMTKDLAAGIALYRSRKYADALDLFLALSPDAAAAAGTELLYYIGLSFARLKKYEDSLMYLEQVVSAGEGLDRVRQCRLILAVVYTVTGRCNLAEYELKTLLESGWQTASVYAAMAYGAWEQQQTDTCIDLYEQALLIDSENPTALNGLGYVLACCGKDLTRALGLCKKAIDITPDSPACLDSLGWVYHKLGIAREAENYIRRARTYDPENTEIEEHFRVITAQSSLNRGNDRISLRGGRS